MDPEVCNASHIRQSLIRLARARTTHVKDEQWVFAVHDLRGAVRRNLDGFLVPPEIPSVLHGHLVSSSLEDQNLFDERAVFERRINDGFRGDRLSTSFSLAKRL